MIKFNLNATKKIGGLLALALTTASGTALATDPTSGSVDGTVTYTEARDGALFMQVKDASNNLVNVFAYSVAPPSPCQTWIQSSDALKSYQSVAQSALLSGKHVHVLYNICDPSGQKLNHAWLVGMNQ